MGITKTGIKTIITSALMVGAGVTAQVGKAFYAISQLPTAAAFGKAFLTTLKGTGLGLGVCAGVALVTDLFFNYAIKEILKDNGARNSRKAQALGYLAKRAITVVTVVGTALIMGSSPIVPIATIIILLVRDLLGKVVKKIRHCLREKQEKEIEKRKKQEEEIKKQEKELIESYKLAEEELLKNKR